MHSGDLAPQGQVQGWLPFQIPRGDRNLTLHYNANCLGCTDSIIKLQ